MAYRNEIKEKSRILYRDRSASDVERALRGAFPDEDIPDVRTIRRWGKEPEVMESGITPVLLDSPQIVQARANHSKLLLGIVDQLQIKGLDSIRVSGSESKQYTCILKGGQVRSLSEGELTGQLQQRLKGARLRSTYEVKLLLQHLVHEVSHVYPHLAYKSYKDYERFITESPYEAVKLLRQLKYRKTFKGTCEVCEVWQ